MKFHFILVFREKKNGSPLIVTDVVEAPLPLAAEEITDFLRGWLVGVITSPEHSQTKYDLVSVSHCILP